MSRSKILDSVIKLDQEETKTQNSNTANTLKSSLIENLVSNVKEQNKSDMLVEYASLFHIERMISLDERILLLKKLQGTNYVHRIPKERDGWDKFEITLCHLRKISCKEKEIIKDFKNLWPIINRVWSQYTEAVIQKCSVKMFLKISQNSQENTCARVSFLTKLQASGLKLY